MGAAGEAAADPASARSTLPFAAGAVAPAASPTGAGAPLGSTPSAAATLPTAGPSHQQATASSNADAPGVPRGRQPEASTGPASASALQPASSGALRGQLGEDAQDHTALDTTPAATAAITPATAAAAKAATDQADQPSAPASQQTGPVLPGALGPLPRSIAPRHDLLHGGLAASAGAGAASEPASSVRFFINGRPCGIAFAGLTPALRYFPSASCLRGGAVTLNPGPDFVCPPRKAADAGAWRPLSEAVDDQAAAADNSAR